ncbi:MAG: hypothetical protein IJ137_03695 [Eubacterium sp.]|nr:hypothetical protein [Eubacterium sp.]
MNYRGPLPKIVYYGLVILLLAALVLLFYAERRQSMEYSAYHDKKEAGSSSEITASSEAEDAEEKTTEADPAQEAATDASEDVTASEDTSAAEETTEAAETASAANADKVYESLSAALKEALPGIICIGDEGMAGNEAGSLPDLLAPAVNDSLLGNVKQELSDSSSSQDVNTLDIPLVNMGIAGEDLPAIVTSVKDKEAEGLGSYVPVFFFEGNSGMSAQSLIEAIDDIRSVYKSDQYVLVASTYSGSRWDDALTEAYGDHYILNETHLPDMTEEDFKNITDKVYESLNNQGTFDNVRKAVTDAESDIEKSETP